VTGQGEGSGKGGRRSSLSGGQRQLRTTVKTGSKRSASSVRWLERQLNDPYVAASKREGLRSRAAFKLREIDARYHFLKPGQRVIDLGAAPGGWSQVAAERVKAAAGNGQVVAIDYLSFDAIPGVEIIKMDFTDPGAEALLKSRLRGGRADVVLSDMAAPTVGHAKTDHLRIMGLAESAAAFAADVLEPGGVFLCKVFQGGTERDLLDALKRDFRSVRHVKPPASRAESSELYVLATGFRGKGNAPANPT
jgi:23S rRNA (uridine2552-2'-O)-methyltransferase